MPATTTAPVTSTESIEPERFFSFRWHPYTIEEGVNYDAEPTTLVTFTLEEAGAGTKLAIVESGFDAIPDWDNLTLGQTPGPIGAGSPF